MRRGTLVVAVVAFALAWAAGAAQACTGSGCYVQATTLGESPATGSSVFRFPQAIAFSPGASTVLVADQYSAVVQRFDRTGAWLGELGGYADARQTGRIGVVGGLATDRAGHVYVLDSENDRVQVFASATGQWLAAWGSTGQAAGLFRLGDNTGAGGIAIDQPTAAATPSPTSPTSTTTASRPSASTRPPRATPATRCCPRARARATSSTCPPRSCSGAATATARPALRRPVVQPAA